jgi:hypothetical protein
MRVDIDGAAHRHRFEQHVRQAVDVPLLVAHGRDCDGVRRAEQPADLIVRHVAEEVYGVGAPEPGGLFS